MEARKEAALSDCRPRLDREPAQPATLNARRVHSPPGIVCEVACCFWKEEPACATPLFLSGPGDSRGLRRAQFHQRRIFHPDGDPARAGTSGPETERANGQLWKYCEPVGNHESMTEHLLERAREIAPGISEGDATLLIVAHGTSLNDTVQSPRKLQAEKVRKRGRYAAVLNVYMEEPPLVSDWLNLTETRNVVVVPFFSFRRIAQLRGHSRFARYSGGGGLAAASPSDSSHELHGRSLFYSTAIGTDSRFAT